MNKQIWEKLPVGIPKNATNFVPVTTTKKYLWGLWSRSETTLYMMTDGSIYVLKDATKPKLPEEPSND